MEVYLNIQNMLHFKDRIVAINWEINKNILDVFAGSSVQKRNEPQRHYHYGISNFDQRQVYITDGNEV